VSSPKPTFCKALWVAGTQNTGARAHAWLRITLHIQMLSKEVLRVEKGSLYPAASHGAVRLDQGGVGTSENNRRRGTTAYRGGP